jgi:hypothetical protein
MKVEMAWLADPATFPYPLAAHSVEGNLELRGSLPTESLRQYTVKTARAHTHLPVVNLLQIDAKLPPSEAGVDWAAVRQGAVEVLNDAFGMAARGFEIRAEADGKVGVTGSVNSVEEKLAVSRKLRKVRGCRYASNYLQISPEMRDGRMVTRINAAGTLVVPGQVLCLDGTGQEPSTPNLAPVVPVTAAPARPLIVKPAAAPAVVATPATPPRPAIVIPAAPPAIVTMPAATPVTVPVPPLPPRVTVTTQTVQQPVSVAAQTVQQPQAIRPVAGQAPAAPQPTAKPTSGPAAAAMPIEVPVPKIVTPVPPPMQPLASDRVPPPSKVPGQFDMMVPGPVQAQTRPTAKPTTTAVSVTPPAPVKPVSGATTEKSVDLLAVPTVPESWSKDTTAAPAKAKAPSNFAVGRTPPPLPPTTDELLKLPQVPSAATQVQTTKAMPAIAKPATSTRVTDSTPAVGSVAAPASKDAASKDAKAGTTAVVPAKPATTTAQVPPPALKPLPTPSPTSFKDTWVEAMPAPKPATKADHPQPPPGGWASAHLSRPAPTAYVTSGVVVFQDEPVSVAKPAHPVAPVVENKPVSPVVVNKVEPKPTTQLVSRLEPVPASPVPQPTVHPATTFVVDRTPVSAGAPVTVAYTTKIKQQVERVCGRLATHVEVLTTDKGVTVHVKCADAAAAQKITDRVLTDVPEMADTKVKFEVEVVRQ